MRDLRRSPRALAVLAALLSLTLAATTSAATKSHVVLVVPFDTATLGPDGQWVGDGVAEVLSLGLAQHPAFIQIDRGRVRALGQPDAWGEAVVLQTARALRADVALWGQVTPSGGDLTIQPRLLEVKAGAAEPLAPEPLTFAEA